MEYSDLPWIIEFTENRTYKTQSLSSYQIRSNSWTHREIIAWVLVVILAVLLIVSLAISVIVAMLWAYKRRNKNPSPDCAVAMDSNSCYEASNVKQTEAQEAGHVYEMVKQHA